MRVTVYSKPGCHLCEDVLDLLDKLGPSYGLDVQEVNILEDMALYESLSTRIPVVVAEGGQYGSLYAPITEPELRAYLDMAAHDLRARSAAALGSTASAPAAPSVVAPYNDSAFDRLASWISKHWLRLALIGLGIFVGLPWLAPILASLGWWDVANVIYGAYALQCHQLPERTAHIFGYEVASCFRCNALYGGMLLFGFLYGLARDRKVRWLQWLRLYIPWWVFVLLLLPIVADGISHMLGVRDGLLGPDDDVTFNMFYVGSQAFSLNWWLRIITGLMAGLGSAWFACPRMDRTMYESEQLRQYYKQQSAISYQRSAGIIGG